MTKEEAIEVYNGLINEKIKRDFEFFAPELRESEDERIRIRLSEYFQGFLEGNEDCYKDGGYVRWEGLDVKQVLAWLEKQKENPKNAISIPEDCVSDVKCEDRWHKTANSLPDNGRLVLAQDCLGNTLLARYDGEGNWEVNVYDNNDYYCRNTITKWCEIPSEKQKEQKPAEWSEEDDKMWMDIKCHMIHGSFIPFDKIEWIENRLKSPLPQPQGTYKQIIHSIFEMLKGKDFYGMTVSNCISLLNDIRVKCKDADECAKILDETHWKPSEEQMEALQIIVRYGDKESTHIKNLTSLYEQLKKL